jgi:uncharacterized protein
MKSTVFFRTKKGGFYLYDSLNKHLIISHPIVEQISNVESEDPLIIKNSVMSSNSQIKEFDFDIYYQKYLFLKTNGFFSNINSEELFTGRVTPDVIEKRLSNLGQVVFQVTNDCNLKCTYCCFGELYNGIPVERKNMTFDMVKLIFNYLIPFWNSKKILLSIALSI